MTTRRAPKSAAGSVRPADRAVTAGMLLAVLAGIAWLVGMVWTVTGWAH
ncbi:MULTISPECIES: morphogenic membrane protein MmpA [Streptomyces]|nr:hypothetical protein [Streptomyces ruber]